MGADDCGGQYDATESGGKSLQLVRRWPIRGGDRPPKSNRRISWRKRARAEGLEFKAHHSVRKTGHKYEPRREKRKSPIGSMQHLPKGRPTLPTRTCGLTTYTLRYNKVDWLTVDALEQAIGIRADIDGADRRRGERFV